MQKYKYLIVALCVFFVEHTSVLGQSNSIAERQKEYERGVELMEKNKYSSAQRVFRDFLKGNRLAVNDEYVVKAYYYDAVCAQMLHNADAKYKLEKFISSYPQSREISMAYFYLGNYYYGEKDYGKALGEYRKAERSQINPDKLNEYEFKFGYSFLQTGNSKKAQEYFARVMIDSSLYTNTATYYYAHIMYEEGKYEVALSNFEKLLTDNKFSKIVPYYIAQIYFHLNKDNELIALAPELINNSNDTRKAEIEQMVAEVYYKQGEYAKALEHYENANATIPNKNAYQMGYCNYQIKEYSKAVSHFSLCIMEADSIAQNALYHVGDIYLKQNKKQEAIPMFLQAAKLDFNHKITEDALYNYAKLTCEMGNSHYNESIKSFHDYLAKYPKTEKKAEINEILSNLYFSVRNYKSALEMIEKMTDRTPEINEAYQRVAINRGIELFNERKYTQAITEFSKAIKTNTKPLYTAQALYLRGECKYRIKDYAEAKVDLNKFVKHYQSNESGYYKQALYTLGYTQMKLKEYKQSTLTFTEFLLNTEYEEDKQWINDVNIRIADNYFIQKSYKDAIAFYNKAIDANADNADYAMYQKGLSYGALCLYQNKIDCMNMLMSRYPKSDYVLTSNFEIANTFLLNDEQELALKFYTVFINKYPNSSYTKEALLKIGIINYNLSRDKEALESLDKVLKEYPGTAESRDALLTIKNIYLNQNRVDEYFNYVKQNTKVAISNVEQDSIMFTTAEARYMEGDCQTAIPSFESYLSKFPNGLFSLTANYYLADCHMRSGSMWKALPYYEYVAKQSKSQYTEVALLNVANISYNIKNYKKSNDYFKKLAAVSEIESNILHANIGIMRTWYLQQDYLNTIESATTLLQHDKLTIDISEEAHYMIATSYYHLGDTAAARLAFEPMKLSNNGAYVGEAYYREAEAHYQRKDMKRAEQVIETIAASPVSDYWLAKSFILWADIYYSEGNRLQAKQTLQSIIENYDGEDLVAEATKKYEAIDSEEKNEKEAQEKEIQEMKDKDNEINISTSTVK